LEFKEKQFDGPYEVIEVEINNKGEFFKGLLYYPPGSFQKPFPLVILNPCFVSILFCISIVIHLIGIRSIYMFCFRDRNPKTPKFWGLRN